MDWCATEDDKALCSVNTATACIAVVSLVLHCVRLLPVSRLSPSQETEMRRLVIFVSIITGEIVLTMVEGIFSPVCVSFLFKLASTLLFWISLYLLVVVEAYRLMDWPWSVIPATMFLVNFPDMVYSFLTIQDYHSASSLCYGLWTAKTALSLLAVCVYHCETHREEKFEDDDKVTETIHFRDDYSLPTHNTQRERERDSERERESASDAAAGRWKSWLPSTESRHAPVESAIDRIVRGVRESVAPRESLTERWSNWWSARTSSLSHTDRDRDRESDATQRLLSATDEEEMRRLSQSHLHAPRFSSLGSATSFSSSTNGSAGSSRALLQVMEQHRAKISALNPILEPRGTDDFDDTSAARKKKKNAPDVERESDQDAFDKLRFQVLVHKWGLRNKRKTHSGESDAPPAQQQQQQQSGAECEAEAVQTVAEFEIVVAARAGVDKQHVDWNKASQQKLAVNRWTVWRSTEEIMKFHTQMVNLMGDLIPRRPRLNSSSSSAATLSAAEFNSDMRVIAVYLNALLRSKQFICKPLEDFLELERVKIIVPDAKDIAKTKEPPLPAHKEPVSTEETAAVVKEQSSENGDKALVAKDSPLPVAPVVAATAAPVAPAATPAKPLQPSVSSKQPGFGGAERLSNVDQTAARQEKWRKLFTRMKIKLKPRDIGIRCRLFEGVLSGDDISSWLMRSATADNAGQVDEQSLIDRSEACSIGQELLDCGLLEVVCSGFREDYLHDDHAPFDDDSGHSSFAEKEFSDMPGYVYRLKGKSSHAACWTLFGAPIAAKIPTMTMVEDADVRSTRETTILSLFEAGTAIADGEGAEAAPQSGNTHIQYVIDISHGGDIWQITRRYREFENLHKSLSKEGVRAEVPLPPKTFMSVTRTKSKLNEGRRIGLEQYLASVLQAVIEDGSDKVKLLVAKFLDDEYNNLNVATVETVSEEKTVNEEN